MQVKLNYFPFFFFFSSRRRHTRYWRDWSSDVCSSDLAPRELQGLFRVIAFNFTERPADEVASAGGAIIGDWQSFEGVPFLEVIQIEDVVHVLHDHARSEERRVGKECRSRRELAPY